MKTRQTASEPLPASDLFASVVSGESRRALPTPDEIKADPDRILELYDCCPECGSQALEALTWKSIGSDHVTVGCWECEWLIHPPEWTPPSLANSVLNKPSSHK